MHNEENDLKAAQAQASGIWAECDAKYPESGTAYVERARCQTPGFNLIKPFLPYPDLLDQDIAFRMTTAEKLQSGRVTLSEANLERAQMRSQLIAEEQRRSLGNRAVSAQEAAASAAWRSVSCTRTGNTTNCY